MITTDYISEIMRTVITLQKDNHIFIYLSPHVSQLELVAHIGGWWVGNGGTEAISIYYGDKSYLNPKNIRSQVEEFISQYAK